MSFIASHIEDPSLDDDRIRKEREAQRTYWAEHTPEHPTVETMMLDSKAKDIDASERPEVMNLLGSVRDAAVVELGAGIGRFTGELCRAGARHVLAVDFMAASIAENQRIHSQLGIPPSKLSFLVEDATLLQLPAASADVVFSNWLLMYLADAEVLSLAQRMLEWLTPGGVLFFRESCYKQSGDRPRKDNPTHYRDPAQYTTWFDSVRCDAPPASEEDEVISPNTPSSPSSGSGSTQQYKLQLEFMQPVTTYIKVKNNQNQIVWRWRKVPATPSVESPDRGASSDSSTGVHSTHDDA